MASSLFESRDPALELSYRADEIRREFVRIFLETHMPVLLANAGHAGDPAGHVHSKFDMHFNNQWSIADGPDGALLTNAFALQANVQTSCDTNPVQAVSLIRVNIAEVLAEQFMAALAKEYLGLNQTSSSSALATENGRLTEYQVEDKTSE